MNQAASETECSRYHWSRLRFMGAGRSPTCAEIVSFPPELAGNRLTLRFEVDRSAHVLNVEFPSGIALKGLRPVYWLGVAMAEAYRLAEIITPKVIWFPWYPCADWEQAWWQEDIAWYLQQKFFLEKWPWDLLPKLVFPIREADDKGISPGQVGESDGYLLAVSGGKESTFAWEWLRRAGLRQEAFTLHHSGGYLGNCWEGKFPIFETIRTSGRFHEVRQYAQADPATRFAYAGVRNDPTITNALFLMMPIAQARGLSLLAMANDRSSNEGNAIHEGREINHQSAKGTAYIERFNGYCAAKGLGFRYVSLCEQAYSLGTVEHLNRWNPELLRRISSCNEAQWSSRIGHWCRACPKCAFSYALLEAAAGHELAVATVGEDLVLKPQLRPIWQALFDPELEKPFECVGEKRETAAALGKIRRDRLMERVPLGWLKELRETPDYERFIKVMPPSGISEKHRRQLVKALAPDHRACSTPETGVA